MSMRAPSRPQSDARSERREGGARMPGAIRQEPASRNPPGRDLCPVAGLFLLMAADTQAQSRDELLPPSAFAGINDLQARSRALFAEASKVIMSPRCMNCHPAGDRPLQGNDRHPHMPPVTRGDNGGGVPGNTCRACHTDRNFTIVGDNVSYQSI